MRIKFEFGKNAETLIVCLLAMGLIDGAGIYFGSKTKEKATFINMPAVEKEMTPYEWYYSRTKLAGGDLVHIKIQKSKKDTFAIWPTNVPQTIIGSTVEVHYSPTDAAYVVVK